MEQDVQEITITPAWQSEDPAHHQAIKDFWERHMMLTPDVREARAPEVIALAYAGDLVVAVATGHVQFFPQLRAKFIAYRCAVAPDHRRHDLAHQITAASVRITEEWSAAHPEEKVVGLGAVLESAAFAEKQKRPLWPEWDMNLNLVGYAPNGQQIRVAWYKHAKLEEKPQ